MAILGENMKAYIVCCGTTGRAVVFGYSKDEPVVNEPVTLHDARMVLYWPGKCNGLFGLAANGPKEGLRLSSAVDITGIDVTRQFLSVADSIAKELTAWTE